MVTLRPAALFAAALLFSATLFAQQSTTTPDTSAPPAQTAAPSTPPSPQPTGPTAVFDTSMGRMTCRLFSKEAPNTVANFVGLATGTRDWTDPKTHQLMHGKPLYNGTIFHRVIPGFMIQGGDPLGTGEGDPGYKFNDEIVPGLNFDVAGRLAMANSGANTDGSQFFITVAATPWLNQHYTIFGQCDDSSVWVAKSITDVNRDPNNNRPVEPVVLDKVTIVPAGQPLPPPPTAPAPAVPAAPAKATAPQS
jgi:peptidyl-prolyl cis-trans isomerase A (cyclophilin A)